jgi:hypothetical protein
MFFRSAWCCDCRARRRRTRIAITVLVLIAFAALARSHTKPAHTPHSHRRPAHTQTARAKATRSHGAAAAPARSPAARTAPASSPGALAAAGQDLSWAAFHGIQLPVSASDGPRDMRGGLASGFTDTPRGALLAAISIGVRAAAQWGPGIFRPTITRQVTGPDTAALLHAETSAYARLRAAAHVRPGQPTGRGYAVEAAYRFVAWTPADATVDVVTAGPGSGGATVLASTRIQVIWLRGDWRVVAPPGGDWGNEAAVISSLTGYTIFPGER